MVVSNLLYRNKSFKQQIFNVDCRKNPTEFQTLLLNDLDALKKSNYNPNADVKFYCTGWDSAGLIAYAAKDGSCIDYLQLYLYDIINRQTNYFCQIIFQQYYSKVTPNVNISFCLTEYLLREDVNVFSMDWRSVQTPNYTNALNITFETGLHIG